MKIESPHTMKASKTLQLSTPIQYLKGVGPKLGTLLEKHSIHTVGDLLNFVPRDYIFFRPNLSIDQLRVGEAAQFQGRIAHIQFPSAKTAMRRNAQLLISDVLPTPSSKLLSLKWFRAPWGFEKQFRVGQVITILGTPQEYLGRLEMTHPTIRSENLQQSAPEHGAIIPIYSEISGLSTSLLSRLTRRALADIDVKDYPDIPDFLKIKRGLVSRFQALQNIHCPPSDSSPELLKSFRSPAQVKFIYDEFFEFQTRILKRRAHASQNSSFRIRLDLVECKTILEEFKSKLPFELTQDQSKILEVTLDDVCAGRGVNRLIQGDVGSGKTIVVLLLCACFIAQGFQTALMVPTEILAGQHFQTVLRFFKNDLPVEWITGSTPTTEKNRVIHDLKEGKPLLLIGTHALIYDSIQFKNLGLVIIDEQHRFGVIQREKLREKAKHDAGMEPHFLVLSATPIPRTLALTAYGDLSVASIRSAPKGRKPIKTYVVREPWKSRALERVREEINKGRQAYFICPLVEASESESFDQIPNVQDEFHKLKTHVYPEFKLGLLHGQLPSHEKESVMRSFSLGEIQILVATTVVEVGVDVPNANVMAVYHSERFGLAQLHQLRGRVGRGNHDSLCFLFTGEHLSPTSLARLNILEETLDGFKIAQADLRIRGPGEFLGIRQAGELPFKVADLVRDEEILEWAREDAVRTLANESQLPMIDTSFECGFS